MTSLTIVIPAKNESHLIERTLASVAAQRGVQRSAFDTIVFANDCSDDTAERARHFARGFPGLTVDVIEGTLPSGEAHVGRARRTVMDEACARFGRSGRDGIIASTDADTVLDPFWVANTLLRMRGVDAVAGRIDLIADEERDFSPHLRSAYERDARYHGTVALLEATLDPVPWDPPPRHASHFGGSFAVRASAYERVGGLPVLPALEDVAFYCALFRADARIAHAPDVRVQTSARRHARVTGGFATHVEDLANLRDWLVEDPRATIANVRARAALRVLCGTGAAAAAYAAEFAALGFECSGVEALVDRSLPFGENWHRLETAAARCRPDYPPVPVASALAAMRAEIAAVNAAAPTRMSAASGAG